VLPKPSKPKHKLTASRTILNATGDVPPQLTQACSVVAAAQDRSSYQIYYYGGYDGLSITKPHNDNVYVLSVPSMKWFKVYNGTASHARRAHNCHLIYPDQMLVIGGTTAGDETCVEDGPFQIFNLNKLEWQTNYDPTAWSEYEVPDIISASIGGKLVFQES
jgi:Kelch motif